MSLLGALLFGVSIWQGWLALAAFWEVGTFLMMMPWAIWYGIQRARARRAAHPDNNFHNLPLLNAIGFNKHGAPILRGTPEGDRYEYEMARQRLKLEREIKANREKFYAK